MKRTRIEEAAEYIEILMNYLIVYCILDMLFSSTTGNVPLPFLRYAGLAVVPCLLYQVRKRVTGFTVFFAIHIALFPAGLMLLPSNAVERVGFLVFLAFYIVYSLYLRLVKGCIRESSIGIVPAGILMGICFITGIYLGQDRACGRILNAVLLYVFLNFIAMYLNNFTGYVEVNKSSCAHVPEQSMFRAGFAMTAVFSGLVLLVLALVPNDGLVAVLGSGLKELARMLLTVILALFNLFGRGDGAAAEPAGDMTAAAPPLPDVSPTPYWLELLGQILQKAVTAALMILVCWLIIRAVRALIRRFYVTSGYKHTAAYEQQVEKKEKLNRRDLRKRSQISLIPALTSEGKIRRIYKKTVERYPFHCVDTGFTENEQKGNYASRRESENNRLESTLKSSSARELAALASGTGAGEAFLSLAVLYEKARYGERCSREEVKEAALLSRVILKKQA